MQIVAVIVLIALDRASKILAETFLAGGQSLTLIPGILELELLPGGNTGAAFGLFGGSTWVLALFSLVCSAVFLWILCRKQFVHPLAKWAFVLITAGAIGNLYDRVVYGSVTDFFKLLFVRFPYFNVADCFVDVGAVLFVIYVLFLQKDQPMFRKAEQEAEEPDDQ